MENTEIDSNNKNSESLIPEAQSSTDADCSLEKKNDANVVISQVVENAKSLLLTADDEDSKKTDNKKSKHYYCSDDDSSDCDTGDTSYSYFPHGNYNTCCSGCSGGGSSWTGGRGSVSNGGHEYW